MKIQAIVPAAGEGSRLQSDVPKPLVLLKGKPLIVYALEVLEACSLVENIIVVAPELYRSDFENVIKEYQLSKVIKVVRGGDTRCRSVSNGLAALDEDTKYVLIHDGARPMISAGVVEQTITACFDWPAVVTAVPVKPTIKRIKPEDLTVIETLDRDVLWEIQTPQVFQKDIIVKAHKTAKQCQTTDDAFLVEKLGEKVKVVQGDYRNIKITTKEDLFMAESLLDK